MSNESIPCNVVILPNVELSQKAITASKSLESLGTLFTLEISKYYPHISVYMLQLRIDDIPKVQKLLARISSKTDKLNLATAHYHQSHNYFDAEYQKTEKLTQLQSDVVEALNPIRDGMRQNDKARMPQATGLALENFKKFGWNSIGELYRPHLTITRFTNEQAEPEKLLPKISEFSDQFPELGLFKMGDNGTCVRKIAKWELQF